MKGKYKQFDPELYKANDRRAIDTIRNHLSHTGLYVLDNDDQYGPDLVVYKGFKPSYYVECEVKLVWKTDTFQFPTLQLPERKRKFTKLGKPIEFWILNNPLTHALVIPDYVLEDNMLVEVPNKYNPNGELFYQVPIDRVVYVEIQREIPDDEVTIDIGL